jgi:hypothetical protein
VIDGKYYIVNKNVMKPEFTPDILHYTFTSTNVFQLITSCPECLCWKKNPQDASTVFEFSYKLY